LGNRHADDNKTALADFQPPDPAVVESFKKARAFSGLVFLMNASAFRARPVALLLAVSACAAPAAAAEYPASPNVILVMFDDMGYGDPGFMGNETARTPHMDEMAGASLVFDRFYAQAPVCSPTRGSVLTGRHPFRYGIYFANTGHLPEDEPNLAALLRDQGYRTGMFGKWHLGTLTTEVEDANRGRPGNTADFAPPWLRGFDACFATESKVPTFNPTTRPRDFREHPGNLAHWWDPEIPAENRRPYGTRYWDERGKEVENDLEGPNAKLIMDRALPFIRESVETEKPFLAVIWFHEPHLPVVAGAEDRKSFGALDPYAQHYHGCIAAADREIGRLRAELRRLGIERDTLLWLTSDNGPEGDAGHPGSAGRLRGRKRDLYEGGIRVPGLIEWPRRIPEARRTAVPAVTTDTLPTLAELLDIELPEGVPFDGMSLVPLIDGVMEARPRPIAFQSKGRIALVGNRHKLINATRRGRDFAEPPYQWELYDLIADAGEEHDLADEKTGQVRDMAAFLDRWQVSLQGE
jgi:arylsulfatase A-like enzyme